MYMGFHPFGLNFGFNQRRQAQRPQQRGGGFLNFLNQNFMNPQPRQQNQRNQQEPKPTFYRSQKQTKQKNKSPEKEKQIYNQNTGMYWKMKGNEAYHTGNYLLALKFYSKAIELNDGESVFYSNRAQCYRKIGSLPEALKDAQQAIQLDSKNIRAFMIAGQLLAEIGKLQDNINKIKTAISRFTKALTLSGGKKIELEKQISRYIYLAKKVLFYVNLKEIRDKRILAINQYKEYLDKDENLSNVEKQQKMNDFLNASNERIVFSIPEYLQCPIGYELMEDPVITDSGQTYERSAIEQHIKRNGKTDPFTRKPLKGQLYPCIVLKKAVQQFLENNPWAYEYSEGQDYKKITFD